MSHVYQNCQRVNGLDDRLDYQPLFGKMSPHSSPERAAGRVRFPLLVSANHVTACRFSYGKDCGRNYHIKNWPIAWRSDFDGPKTLGEILESEGTQRFVRLFVVNFSFNDCCWRDFASSRIFLRRFRSRSITMFVTDVWDATVHVYIWQRNIQFVGNSVW